MEEPRFDKAYQVYRQSLLGQYQLYYLNVGNRVGLERRRPHSTTPTTPSVPAPSARKHTSPRETTSTHTTVGIVCTASRIPALSATRRSSLHFRRKQSFSLRRSRASFHRGFRARFSRRGVGGGNRGILRRAGRRAKPRAFLPASLLVAHSTDYPRE